MQTTLYERRRKLHAQTPIIMLVTISLILNIICSLDYFITYSYWSGGDWEIYFALFDYDTEEAVLMLLSYALSVAPIILFAIYIFKFYQKYQASFLIPIILSLIAFSPVFSIITNMILGYGFFSISELLFTLIIRIPFTIAAISTIKGFSKKIYVIAILSGLLCISASFFNCIRSAEEYITDGPYFLWLTWFFNIIGSFAQYIAMLLFVLKNNMSLMTENAKINDKMSPEQSLLFLKEQLELGMIAEEDYQAQRNDIISKL